MFGLGHKRELEEISGITAYLQARVKFIKEEGVNVDAINAALTKLETDVDALIAKGAGSITPAQAQTIVTALTAVSTKIEAAIAT